MRRSFLVESIFIILMVSVVTWVATAFFYQNIMIDSAKNELKDLLYSISSSSGVSYAKTDGKNGSLKFYNAGDAAPEVKEAKKHGFITITDNTGIFGESVVRAARKLTSGSVICASMQVPGGAFTLWCVLPAVAIGAFLSARQTLRLVANIRFMIKGAEITVERAGNEGGIEVKPAPEMLQYSEFSQSAAALSRTATAVSEKVSSLYIENKRIDYLLNNMNEGLAVIGPDFNILVINKSAEGFFDAGPDLQGSNILLLTHTPEVSKTLKEVFETGDSESVDVKSPDGKKTLQVIISPIIDDDEKEISGEIMLISDVTEVRLSEQIRSEFVANASHELKTPLTTIKGFSELIDAGIVNDPEKVHGYLSHIRAETDRMIRIIGDILKLSELEAAGHDSGVERISLKAAAENVVESLVNQINEKNLTVSVTGDGGNITANPGHMEQMLLNLIDNAVKYNKNGGKVEVLVSDTQKSTDVTVKDTGVGIPRESQGRVFERFYRVDKSRSRKIGGTGLGLSIVKHIVGLYDGTIRLDSEQDKGTSITVSFPAGKDD